MNKQELIEKYEKLEGVCKDPGAEIARLIFLEDLRELDELQKVQVPQFVADWIEKAGKKLSLRDLISNSYTSFEVKAWLGESDEYGAFKNQETFAKAVLYGYEVEKEKRYYIRFKFIEDSYSYLTLIKHLNTWTLTEIKIDKKFRTEHTKKQLEQAGFGWVFDCPGIEIEEAAE